MADEPKKLGPSMRPLIESILKKSVDNKTLSQEAYDKAIRKLDMVDNKKKGGVIKKAKMGCQRRGTSRLLKGKK